MRIVFLGTGAGIPTLNRGLPSIFVQLGKTGMLLDCGEGAQRQLLSAGRNVLHVDVILISHLHGDHFFGLYGFLQSCTLLHRHTPLLIVCPPALQSYLTLLMTFTPFHLSFSCTIVTPTPGKPIRRSGYSINCAPVTHGQQAYAFSITEDPRLGKFYPDKAQRQGVPSGLMFKMLQSGQTVTVNGREIRPEEVCDPPTPGAKIVYSGDTAYDPSVVTLAQNATLLIHEATYLDEKDKPAAMQHATLKEALRVADEARCLWLALTHFSARYKKIENYPTRTPGGTGILYAEDLMEITTHPRFKVLSKPKGPRAFN